MKQKDEQEQAWVQSVLDSANDLQRPVLKAELADRILQAALKSRQIIRPLALSPIYQRWAAAASIVALLGLNLFSYLHHHHALQSRVSNPVAEEYFSYLPL